MPGASLVLGAVDEGVGVDPASPGFAFAGMAAALVPDGACVAVLGAVDARLAALLVPAVFVGPPLAAALGPDGSVSVDASGVPHANKVHNIQSAPDRFVRSMGSGNVMVMHLR